MDGSLPDPSTATADIIGEAIWEREAICCWACCIGPKFDGVDPFEPLGEEPPVILLIGGSISPFGEPWEGWPANAGLTIVPAVGAKFGESAGNLEAPAGRRGGVAYPLSSVEGEYGFLTYPRGGSVSILLVELLVIPSSFIPGIFSFEFC